MDTDMPVFAISAADDAKLAAVIEQKYKDNFVHPWPGLFLVADEATTQQVGEKLAIGDGSLGYVYISLAANYWGYGPKSTWEWLDLKRKAEK